MSFLTFEKVMLQENALRYKLNLILTESASFSFAIGEKIQE
jgi:hypothetical protein